jgi:mono/diheme cytochrome c family protein
MRNMRNKKSFAYRKAYMLLLIAMGGLAIMSSCKKNPNHPGYVYLPDMDVSRAYDTYTENPVFEDGKTLREPAEGTIPRGHIPYPYIKDDRDLAEAGRTFFNPMEASAENIERGEVLFMRFCSHCHGDTGNGKGVLFTSGRFLLPPGDLTAEKAVNRPDGEIFHIITVGYGGMAAHGSQIPAEDRWKIIHYVRKVLQAPETLN